MTRADLLSFLAARIESARGDGPLRVGIDGVDAAGKTVLGDELATVLASRGHAVVGASIDGFHNPRSIRYRRGSESARGYYEDSFDHGTLIGDLLAPLRPGGDRRIRTRRFDVRTDQVVSAPWEEATDGTMLIFDGVFLQRPELRAHWELVVFVHADFEVTVARARDRDVTHLGSVEAVERRYMRRYVPGQKLYLERCAPEASADIVIDNNDPDAPRLLRG